MIIITVIVVGAVFMFDAKKTIPVRENRLFRRETLRPVPRLDFFAWLFDAGVIDGFFIRRAIQRDARRHVRPRIDAFFLFRAIRIRPASGGNAFSVGIKFSVGANANVVFGFRPVFAVDGHAFRFSGAFFQTVFVAAAIGVAQTFFFGRGKGRGDPRRRTQKRNRQHLSHPPFHTRFLFVFSRRGFSPPP